MSRLDGGPAYSVGCRIDNGVYREPSAVEERKYGAVRDLQQEAGNIEQDSDGDNTDARRVLVQ